MVTSSNSIALDIRNSGHIGIGKISDRNYTVEVNGSLNATSLCQSGYSVYTTGNLSPVTTDTNQVINSIKSTPYVYFYSYASESTPIGYVGRGSTGSNSIQLSCYYDNISIAAAGDVYLSSHSNTNLTLKDNYHTYVLTGNYNTMPSLGALGVRTFAIRPSTGTSDYGLYMWSLQQTGGGYLQCGYNDGTTNALNLFLQPLGGGVAIGGYGTSPSYTLDLFGNLARMRYLYFTNTSNDGVCGYVGRGGNGNDVELQSYSGSLYLGGYSQNQIVLGSGVQNIGIGTVDPHGCITLGGETKFHYSCAAKLGQAYSSGDYNLYNWIQFYGGGGGIVFVSGVWTSGDVDAFKFCGGGGTSDVIFYMASRGQAVMYRQFYVQDNIIATGAITAGSASDVRLKQNIQLLNKDKAKSIILNSRPVEFIWSSEATSLYDKLVGDDIGLVAQEIEPYLPQAIGEIFNKYKRLDYTKLITPLISVVQDHEESIADLKERVRMLEKENKELKEKLK